MSGWALHSEIIILADTRWLQFVPFSYSCTVTTESIECSFVFPHELVVEVRSFHSQIRSWLKSKKRFEGRGNGCKIVVVPLFPALGFWSYFRGGIDQEFVKRSFAEKERLGLCIRIYQSASGMTSEAEDASSSGAAAPEITEVVSQTTRSCRGCLYYSSILREHGRNPICLGLSRSSEPQVYAVQNEMDKEVTKNFRKFSDFKYACIGYSAHKELSSNQTSSSSSSSQQQQQQQRIDGPGELPYCVGLEFLADRKPTRQGVPAHRPVATSNPPPMIPVSFPDFSVF